MSIDNYVIGVNERSQRICNFKYDGYIPKIFEDVSIQKIIKKQAFFAAFFRCEKNKKMK